MWEVDVPDKASTFCISCGGSLEPGQLRFKWCDWGSKGNQMYLHSNCAIHVSEQGNFAKVEFSRIRKSLGLTKQLREDLNTVVGIAQSLSEPQSLALEPRSPHCSLPVAQDAQVPRVHTASTVMASREAVDAFLNAGTAPELVSQHRPAEANVPKAARDKPPLHELPTLVDIQLAMPTITSRPAEANVPKAPQDQPPFHELPTLVDIHFDMPTMENDDGKSCDAEGEEESPRAHIEKAMGLPPSPHAVSHHGKDARVTEQPNDGQFVNTAGFQSIPRDDLKHLDDMALWPTQRDSEECLAKAADFQALPCDGGEGLDDMAFWPTQRDSEERLARSRTSLEGLAKADIVMAILGSEGTDADPLPRTRELSNRSQEELESLAAVMGLKRAPTGWCESQLSKAERDGVVSMVLETEGLQLDAAPDANDLLVKTKARLEVIAVVMAIKRERVGWARCCPLRGSKTDIVSSLVKAWTLAKLGMGELQAIAIAKGIKNERVEWALCCPPFGDREDVIRAVLRAEALQDRAVARAAALRVMTQAELETLAVRLKIKDEGVGWPRCCPPFGNKADIASAILSFESLWPKPRAELQELALELGVACGANGRKCDVIVAILRAEAEYPDRKHAKHRRLV